MHRLLPILAGAAAAAVLTSCGQGVWLSRSDAIGRAVHEKGVSRISRHEAKLRSWPDFLRVSKVDATGADGPAWKQKVWLVAVAGDVSLDSPGAHERWVIFVYNAVTGSQIGHITGPFDETTGDAVGPDWPPDWSSFPDGG